MVKMENFRRVLLNISKLADEENTRQMKFLLKSKVSRKKLEESKDMMDLFDRLLELDLISDTELAYLRQLLHDTFGESLEISRLLQTMHEPVTVEAPPPARRRTQRASHYDSSFTDSQMTGMSTRSGLDLNMNRSSELESVMRFTAEGLGSQWKAFAMRAGLSDSVITDIDCKYEGSTYRKALSSLKRWAKTARKPTTRQLVVVLRSIPRNDLADDIKAGKYLSSAS